MIRLISSLIVFVSLLPSDPLCAERTGDHVIAVVESIGPENQAQIRIEGEDIVKVVRLLPGELSYLATGDVIEAKIVAQPSGELLEFVFPCDPHVQKQMLAVNNRLRRDTEVRGRKVFRSIGEEIPPFALYNQHGDLIRSSDLRGKTCVINFIFTRCMNPRMCPATTSRMKELQDRVRTEGLENVLLISMTLDPDFDTPGVLSTYASGYGIDGESFYFLGGSKLALLDLREQLGVLSRKDPQWIIDHTMRTVVVDPSGEIVYQVPGSMWDLDDFLKRIALANTKNSKV